VKPSPARLTAPEPDAWLPIHLTASIVVVERIDITGEVELLRIEEGQIDLDRELAELESDFWRTAEADHPFLTGVLPVVTGEPEAGPEDPEDRPDPTLAPAAPVDPGAGRYRSVATPVEPSDPEPARVSVASTPTASPFVPDRSDIAEDLELPVPEQYAQVRPNRPAIAGHRRAVRLRRRVMATVLTVVVGAVLIGVTARALGASLPRRDVTVSVDGRASTIVTRAGSVGDLLAAEGVVLHPGDRVVPPVSSALREGMPIHIVRAFPFTLDVDGTVTHPHTTFHSMRDVRREFRIRKALVRTDGGGRIARHSHLVFRTPHDVALVVDGAASALKAQTALTVGELLAHRKVVLGPNDQVEPTVTTRLSSGLGIHVFRLSSDEVVETKIIPFPTQYRDDPNLAAGHLRTLVAGRNGTARVVSKVVRKDGTIVQWTELRRAVVQQPVPQVLARGTKASGTQKPPPPPVVGGGRYFQSGTATWYQSHAGAGACAHLTLPFGTIVKIVNTANNRSAQCRVGDRGPEAWTGHIIDLNPDVFQQLAPLGTGTISVKLYIL
jgi:uncharacterized protein YabE (DUF348 family)